MYNKTPAQTRKIYSEVCRIKVNFAPGANNPVDSVLADQFEKALCALSNQDPPLESVRISATTNGVHSPGSPHYVAKAIDVHMINGVRIQVGYETEGSVIGQLGERLCFTLDEIGNYGQLYSPTFLSQPYTDAPPADGLFYSHRHHIHYATMP